MNAASELPRLFYKNSYALTGLLLAPTLDAGTVEGLCNYIRTTLDWRSVLRQANLHFCTPLLYVRLRQHGLLKDAPAELRAYLECLHEANLERNEAFRSALASLVRITDELGIDCLILKGGATFCDDLYGDSGARMMGDLDVLVPKVDAPRLQQEMILRNGYVEYPREERDQRLFSEGFERYHLPRIGKKHDPADIEIHWETGSGQMCRAMPASMLWKGKQARKMAGSTVYLPDPTSRLLHATLHALLPRREYISSSISLAHLAEFSALLDKYGKEIKWEYWLAAGAAVGVGEQFRTFRDLAVLLMNRPEGDSDRLRDVSTLAGRYRILAAGRSIVNEQETSHLRDRLKRMFVRIWIRLVYWQKVPAWLWNNYCYLEGFRNLPKRLHVLSNWILRRFVYRLKKVP